MRRWWSRRLLTAVVAVVVRRDRLGLSLRAAGPGSCGYSGGQAPHFASHRSCSTRLVRGKARQPGRPSNTGWRGRSQGRSHLAVSVGWSTPGGAHRPDGGRARAAGSEREAALRPEGLAARSRRFGEVVCLGPRPARHRERPAIRLAGRCFARAARRGPRHRRLDGLGRSPRGRPVRNRPCRALECDLCGASIDVSPQALLRRGRSATLLVRYALGADHVDEALPDSAPTSNSVLPLLPNLTALSERVRSAAIAASGRLAPGASVGVDALTWLIAAPNEQVSLTVGPGPLSVSRETSSLEIRFSTDPSSASTPLAVQLVLPVDAA